MPESRFLYSNHPGRVRNFLAILRQPPSYPPIFIKNGGMSAGQGGMKNKSQHPPSSKFTEFQNILVLAIDRTPSNGSLILGYLTVRVDVSHFESP